MRKLVTIFAVVMVLAGAVQASPTVGTFDSRDAGSTIGLTFWDDCTEVIGAFYAYGTSSVDTQWYIEAQDPDWNGGWMGYIQLNSLGGAPWFGDDAAVVAGYEGQITGWTLEKNFTYDELGEITNLDLVLKGTALLDQKHMVPWYDWTYENMSPVLISFEMGFSGMPDIGVESWELGQIYGTPDYLVVSVVPVPGAVLLGSIGAGLVGWMKRRKSL